MQSRTFVPADSSWIPADDGVTDDTVVVIEGVGGGGEAVAGDYGAGGSAGYSKITITIADASLTYQIEVAQPGTNTTFRDPDNVLLLQANHGAPSSGLTGGNGGAAGIGDVTYAGAKGGDGFSNTEGGGGGAGAAGDNGAGTVGENGTALAGGAGGTGQTQFGVNGGAGGNGGFGGSGQTDGSNFGGGAGGGNAQLNGAPGSLRATWGEDSVALLFGGDDNGGVQFSSSGDIADGYG